METCVWLYRHGTFFASFFFWMETAQEIYIENENITMFLFRVPFTSFNDSYQCFYFGSSLDCLTRCMSMCGRVIARAVETVFSVEYKEKPSFDLHYHRHHFKVTRISHLDRSISWHCVRCLVYSGQRKCIFFDALLWCVLQLVCRFPFHARLWHVGWRGFGKQRCKNNTLAFSTARSHQTQSNDTILFAQYVVQAKYGKIGKTFATTRASNFYWHKI